MGGALPWACDISSSATGNFNLNFHGAQTTSIETDHAGNTLREPMLSLRDSPANPLAAQEHAMGLRTQGGKSYTISSKYAGQRDRHALCLNES
eukprot:14357527-Heterocapsa_arctica.AAC.1